MKTLLALMLSAAIPAAHGGDTGRADPAVHRYLVERSFPAGALDGLDRAAKDQVNATNARFGVNWVMSYANADRTRTYCIYEGPDEAAIREAAKANGIPVDAITRVPVTLMP